MYSLFINASFMDVAYLRFNRYNFKGVIRLRHSIALSSSSN